MVSAVYTQIWMAGNRIEERWVIIVRYVYEMLIVFEWLIIGVVVFKWSRIVLHNFSFDTVNVSQNWLTMYTLFSTFCCKYSVTVVWKKRLSSACMVRGIMIIVWKRFHMKVTGFCFNNVEGKESKSNWYYQIWNLNIHSVNARYCFRWDRSLGSIFNTVGCKWPIIDDKKYWEGDSLCHLNFENT